MNEDIITIQGLLFTSIVFLICGFFIGFVFFSDNVQTIGELYCRDVNHMEYARFDVITEQVFCIKEPQSIEQINDAFLSFVGNKSMEVDKNVVG